MAPVTGDPRPSGFGISVVFDWALAVQLTTQAVAGQLGRLGLALGWGQSVGRLAGAIALAALGEALRRGRRTAAYLQVLLGAAISIGGAVLVARLIAGRGSASSVFPAAIMVTFAPWMAWRLLSPQTTAFLRSEDAVRRRTDARWLSLVLAQSTVWGVAVALSEAL